uniref:Uncharacterized protein n=1 Tax=Caenorhabditis japonica TaxID=281687 RepID=A0A8R1HTQ3_CAEJA
MWNPFLSLFIHVAEEMTTITDANFLQYAPQLRESILCSDFIAIDFEFFGLDTDAISLHDTIETRYCLLRNNVIKYRPCQLGLSIFKQMKNGSYVADTYSIPLLRRTGPSDSLLNTKSMRFLMNHELDLRQIFAEGVEYCNRSELKAFQRALKSGELLSSIGKENVGKIECLKVMLLEKIYQANSELITHSTEEFIPPSPALNPRSSIALKMPGAKKSTFEICVFIYEMTKSFPQFQFSVDEQKFSLIVNNLPNMIDRNENLKHAQNKCLEAFVGISAIMETAMLKRKLIVGHNSLLDFIYMYHYFFETLPESYDDFKRIFHKLCPKVVDTKVLALMLRTEIPEVDNSLEHLGNFFHSDRADRMVPPEIRGAIKLWTHNGNTEEFDQKSYHDAGYDAYITGSVFLKLAHIFVNKRNLMKNEIINFKRMLQFLVTSVQNRLPFQLLDVGWCNLAGKDEKGFRPDIITVVRRDRQPIDVVEFKKQEDDLEKVMATYKFSMERTRDQMAILLATNTPSSYAFLCSRFSKNKTLGLRDELQTGISMTFEQRLMSWRLFKDEMSEFNPSTTLCAYEQVRKMEAALLIEARITE